MKKPVAVDNSRSNQKYINYAFCFFSLVVAIIFFGKVDKFALNIPYRDDYDAILGWVLAYKKASLGDRLTLLMAQHNEHRMLWSRLVYAIYYHIFGEVNFRTLIFLADFQLVVLWGTLTALLSKFVKTLWAIPAFVLALCLFDLNNFENADFAMAGMTNFGIVMLLVLGLFFYSRPGNKNLALAVFFQFMAAFSSGNGSIAGITLVAYCIISKDKRRIIISSAAWVLFTALYFVGYQSPESSQGAFDLTAVVTYFLYTIGAHFGFESGWAYGLLMLGVLAFVLPIKKGFKFTEGGEVFLALLAFILGSYAVIAIFRSHQDLLQAYGSRYFIYTHLLTFIIFTFIFVKLESKKLKWPVVIASLLLLISTYRKNYDYGIANFKLEVKRLTGMEFCYPDEEKARKLTSEGCKEGVYCLQEERKKPR